jgi:hypothetical protein
MYLETKQKFLFKCEECNMILSVELEEDDDVEKAQKGTMKLECPCGGCCNCLKN